jgi:uncharacterized protein (TIGR04141 family)
MPGHNLARLAIYLLKKDFSKPQQVLSEKVRREGTPVVVGGKSIGHLYVEPQSSHAPSWAKFFDDARLPSQLFPSVSGASAAFIVRAGGRLFALTFGQGRHLLKPGVWEERFGLLVTVNAIAPESLRSIDRKTLDENVRHTREQVSRRSSIAAFGLNPEQDLLRAVTGAPDDDTLGAAMTGMDALNVSAPITLATLPDLLKRYLTLFGSNDYQKNFSWIDHIHEVHDAVLKQALDEALIDRLQASTRDRVWLAVPEVLDWTDVAGFRYGTSRRRDLQPDLHLAQFLDHVDGKELTIDRLRTTPVICYSESTDAERYRWPVLQCLYCEIDLSGDLYLLSVGKWYRVSQSFVDEVKQFYADVTRSSLVLPACSETDELAYNTRAAKESNGHIALMDRKIVRVDAARDKVEFCDLYTDDKELVHVKRYGGSSVLSHLFAQGVVSADLFVQDPNFRKSVNKHLPATHKLPTAAVRASDYEVVYAIVSRSKSALDLPFFSKVSLRVAVRRIRALGYNVSLAKIETA